MSKGSVAYATLARSPSSQPARKSDENDDDNEQDEEDEDDGERDLNGQDDLTINPQHVYSQSQDLTGVRASGSTVTASEASHPLLTSNGPAAVSVLDDVLSQVLLAQGKLLEPAQGTGFRGSSSRGPTPDSPVGEPLLTEGLTCSPSGGNRREAHLGALEEADALSTTEGVAGGAREVAIATSGGGGNPPRRPRNPADSSQSRTPDLPPHLELDDDLEPPPAESSTVKGKEREPGLQDRGTRTRGGIGGAGGNGRKGLANPKDKRVQFKVPSRMAPKRSTSVRVSDERYPTKELNPHIEWGSKHTQFNFKVDDTAEKETEPLFHRTILHDQIREEEEEAKGEEEKPFDLSDVPVLIDDPFIKERDRHFSTPAPFSRDHYENDIRYSIALADNEAVNTLAPALIKGPGGTLRVERALVDSGSFATIANANVARPFLEKARKQGKEASTAPSYEGTAGKRGSRDNESGHHPQLRNRGLPGHRHKQAAKGGSLYNGGYRL